MAAGLTSQFKALISLSPRYAVHPDDKNIPMHARDYLEINGKVLNIKKEIVATNATDFWSEKHQAIILDLSGNITQYGIATGSKADGTFADTCATDDTNGMMRGCNCDNLQTSDGGHGKRFAAGWAVTWSTGSSIVNWAFSLPNKEGNTICTFNHSKYAPPPIYCVEQK
jgi:hypothetical protein